MLDNDGVSMRDRLAHAAGHETDAVFENFYFLGNADAHDDLTRKAAANARERRSLNSLRSAAPQARSQRCTMEGRS
jgi:hypothetical protein